MDLTDLDPAGLVALAPEWDALAAAAGGPFLTTAWLGSWGRAFGGDRCVARVLVDDGRLLAGGCFVSDGARQLDSAANAHSNDWDIVAVDDASRRRFWEALAQDGSRRLTVASLPEGSGASRSESAALRQAGYRVAEQEVEPSPWLELPGSLEELLRERSRNLRSQVGRRRRGLEKEGEVAFRVTTGGPALERDLEALMAVEASGWKGRSGTAIAASDETRALYRDFAEAAARAGWLRLYLLEVDGETIAADYGVAFAGCGYLLKTGFREDWGQLAPGLVLRAEVLQASIDEGLERYDFLGGPDGYKLRWADRLRGRSTLRAFRGPGSMPRHVWWSRLRPALKAGRERVRERVARRGAA